MDAGLCPARTFDWVAAEPVCRQIRKVSTVRCRLLVTVILPMYGLWPLAEIVTSSLVSLAFIGDAADAEEANSRRAATAVTADLIARGGMSG